MTNEEIKELEKRTYAIGWSGFPIDALFNDIRDNNNPRFNKDLAYQDFKKIIDEIYRLKDKAQKYDEKATPKKRVYVDTTPSISSHFICPVCRTKVSPIGLYCDTCGQRLE